MSRTFDAETALRQHGAALRTLAVALLGDRHAADDVVQDTWLRAVERPPPHGTSFGGWLATVLRHLALQRRRTDARRGARECVAGHREALPDTASDVAREELLRRVVDAVLALEPPYRSAIWERYFEDRSPRAIAARTGEPVATIKSRLQRGLSQLRARLEREVGVDWRHGLAVAFGFGRDGLAVAATAGAWTMGTGGKVSIGGVVVLVIGAVAWSWASGDRTSTLPSDEHGSAPQSLAIASHSETPSGDQGRDVAPEIERADIPAPATPNSRRADPPVVLRGRVVAAESSRPLADVTIAASSAHQVASGSDGRFELAVEAASLVGLSARATGRVSMEWGGAIPTPGRTFELGDLVMRAGFDVRGQLVDERSTPLSIEGKFISVRLPQPDHAGSWRAASRIGTRTDAHGRFVIAGVPPGELALELQSDLRLVSPQRIAVDETHGIEPLLVVVRSEARSRPFVSGFVVDEGGRGVAGVKLWADTDSCTTAEDGSFCIVARGAIDTTATTVVSVVDPGPCDPHPPVHDVAWNTADLRIVLHRSATIELAVVGEDGTPVEEYGVATSRDGADRAKGAIRLRGTHADGELSVDRITPGHTVLRVLPSSVEWAPSEPIPVVDTQRLRVVLARRIPCRVVVVADESPVAGAEVELVRMRGTIAGSTRVRDPRGAGLAWMPEQIHDLELLTEDTTAADGTTNLWRDRDTAELALRVRAAGYPDRTWNAPSFPPDGSPLRVELPACGSIAGRVALRGRAATLDIECVRAGDTTDSARIRVPLQPDASFVVEQVPVGDYRVSLRVQVVPRRSGLALASLVTWPESSQLVRVARGETSQVSFDVDAHPRARLVARVRAAGVEPSALRVDLVRQGEDRDARFGEFTVGEDGVFTAEDVLPGTYRLAFRIGAGEGEVLPAVQDEPIELLGGETANRTVEFVRRRLVVHLRHHDGSVAKAVKVFARSGGCHWPGASMLVFGRAFDGTVVFDPAPATPIVFGFDGEAWSAPVTMPEDRREAEATVVLPRRS